MKLSTFFIFSSIGVSAGAQTAASDNLIRSNACTACHAQSSKLVGPSFDSIRQRYGSSASSAAALAGSIKAGGSGKWGPVPMPPQSALSHVDALRMAKLILNYQDPFSSTTVLPQVVAPQPKVQNQSASIEDAKNKCESLGFTPKTESFASCVLRLSN